MIKILIKKILIKKYNLVNKKNNRIESYLDNLEILEDYIVISNKCSFDSVIEKIGRGTYINKETMILNCKKIGRYCSIAHNVKIGVGSHPINWISTSPMLYSPTRRLVKKLKYDNKKIDKEIIIGNDVWIGCNVVIMPGVNIANGAIIAAGSVVTKDVEAYSIVGGIPAKKIKYRFEKEKIKKINQSNWWDLEIDILKNEELRIDDIDEFIKQIKQIK